MPTNTIFTDSLVRANANPLSGGYTTLTGNNALQLISNNVEGTTIGSANAAIYTGGTWPADQGISIVIGALANTSAIGVLLRGSPSLNTAYICSITGTAGVSSTWRIQLDNGGVISTLSSGSVTPALGDTLYAFVQGSTITFQRNGVTLGTATDSTISTGDAGLYANPATALTDVIISAPVTGFDFISVTITPTSLNTVLGGQKTFAAVVSGQGTSTSNVTWFVDGSSGGNTTVGTISAAGLYVAPATVPVGGFVTVTAQAQADNFTFSAATTVNIYRNATVQSYAPNDGASLANFKAACQLFSQNLPTLGWTQVPLTTDVGQVQWNNLTTAVFGGNFGNYFNEENSFASETWLGAWAAGTTYTGGSFNNGNGVQLVTYTDVNHPQVTYNNTQQVNQNYSLTQVVPNTNQSFSVTSVSTSGAGVGGTVANYTGTFGATSWVGYIFTITGFASNNNNGTYYCSVSSSTTLTLSNPGATAQSATATATSSAVNVGYVNAGQLNNGDVGVTIGQSGFAANGGQNNLVIVIAGSSAVGYGGAPLSGTAIAETHSGSGWYAPPSNTVPFSGRGGTANAWQPYLYEIYQSTDALSATCPIYLKLQYFCWQQANANGQGRSGISMVISVGTAIGANGSPSNQANGTIIGNVARLAYWVSSTYSFQNSGEYMLLGQFNGTAAGTTVPLECDFSGNGGNLRVCMFRNPNLSTGAPIYFSIERAKDANGNDLDTYFTVNVSGAWFNGIGANWGYNGMQQSTVFKPGTGSATNGTVWQTLGFNQNDLGFQGILPAFPIFPCPGYVGNPLLGTIVLPINDQVSGELAECVVYGQTHTYLTLGGNFSLTQNAPNQNTSPQSFQFGTVAMLWENV